MIVREAQVEDAPKVAQLMGQLGYPITEEEMRSNIQNFFKMPWHLAWVVEEEKEIVGCVALSIGQMFHRNKKSARITAIVVDEKHRRKGIGRLLLHTAEKYAKHRGCEGMELTSGIHRAPLGSHDFYKAFGYEEFNDRKKYFVKSFL